ncbi:MAG: type II toxin-antitoxin system VapC family toxin [Mycobacteriales bacterium]
MGTVVLDASVLIGALDPSDTHHTAAAHTLYGYRQQGFSVPASALAESLVATARDAPDSLLALRDRTTRLFGPTRVIDDDVAMAAARLRAEHKSLRLPDALVIATGIVDDASVILTGDARWDGVDERVELLGTD